MAAPAPQEFPQQAQPVQDSRMQRGGRGMRRGSRIQGGWASDVQPRGQRQERGRGRGRGRGRERARGYQPPGMHQGTRGPHPDGRYQGGIHQESNPYNGSYHQRHPPPGMNPGGVLGVWQQQPQDLSYGPSQYCIGQPQDQDFTVTFTQPDEPIKKTIEARMIEKSGKEVISTEPSGTSEVELITDFLSHNEADEAFCRLEEEVNWKQQMNKNRDGDEYKEPRLVAWYGDHPYSYSKLTVEANKEWPPMLSKLKEKIEKETALTFNSVLANMYRSEKDGVAWHSDDEYGLREQPKIASLSLGETRMFEMRKKPPKGSDPWNYDYSDSDKLTIPLTHGTLLLMTGCTQDDWQHRVPKEYHRRDMRINLTFRNIYQDNRQHRNTNS